MMVSQVLMIAPGARRGTSVSTPPSLLSHFSSQGTVFGVVLPRSESDVERSERGQYADPENSGQKRSNWITGDYLPPRRRIDQGTRTL
jgi:hypothetical protein